MTIDRLREVYSAMPFQPFAIHMADGRSIHVMSREFIAAAPSGRTAVVFQPDDSMNIIDFLLVTDIEMQSNGQSVKPASSQEE